MFMANLQETVAPVFVWIVYCSDERMRYRFVRRLRWKLVCEQVESWYGKCVRNTHACTYECDCGQARKLKMQAIGFWCFTFLIKAFTSICSCFYQSSITNYIWSSLRNWVSLLKVSIMEPCHPGMEYLNPDQYSTDQYSTWSLHAQSLRNNMRAELTNFTDLHQWKLLNI